MNKLYVGLLLGLTVGSTLSSGFQRTAGEAVSRTTRSVLGVGDSIRLGTGAIVQALKTEGLAVGASTSEARQVEGVVIEGDVGLHSVAADEKASSPVGDPASWMKPISTPILDVSQVGWKIRSRK